MAPVYSSPLMTIYELPGTAPYFEVVGGPCTIEPRDRTRVSLRCTAPARLVRRELFFPGWRAWVNGTPVGIDQVAPVFQAVPLPAGAVSVRFAYSPPFIDLAWLAALAGLAWLAVTWLPAPRRRSTAWVR